MPSVRHPPQNQRFDHLGFVGSAFGPNVRIPVLPFPWVFPGVQGDSSHGELLGRQVVVTVFIAAYYHAKAGRMFRQ